MATGDRPLGCACLGTLSCRATGVELREIDIQPASGQGRRRYLEGFTLPRRFMAQLFEENLTGITVLRISGSLTLAGLPAIEARLNAIALERGVRVVADIGQVDAITTPAITVMLRTARAIERGGGMMVFANANPDDRQNLCVLPARSSAAVRRRFRHCDDGRAIRRPNAAIWSDKGRNDAVSKPHIPVDFCCVPL